MLMSVSTSTPVVSVCGIYALPLKLLLLWFNYPIYSYSYVTYGRHDKRQPGRPAGYATVDAKSLTIIFTVVNLQDGISQCT